MRRHVVGAFAVVLIEPFALRRERREDALEIAQHGGVGVLLNDERGGGVPAEEGEQAHAHALLARKGADGARHVVKTFAARLDAEVVQGLAHGANVRAGEGDVQSGGGGQCPAADEKRRQKVARSEPNTLIGAPTEMPAAESECG